MQTPQFLFEEFVDNTIFNTATSLIIGSAAELASNGTFLIPGIINPQMLVFGFNNSLIVTVTTPDTPNGGFKCLFFSGHQSNGHGTVDGVVNTTYSIDFTGLVPGSGSVTAYIVATQGTVQENVTTILGAPPGHPDYASNFVPYNGYTIVQDSLIITATLTPPDNLSSIELARVTLTNGQTQINAVDTTHQVLARLNVSTALNGDITGPAGSNRITNLQGNPVLASSPSSNSALIWNGTDWIPAPYATLAINMAGDVIGTTANNIAIRSSNPTFTTNNIVANGNVTANGTITAQGPNGNIGASGFISAAGEIFGANAAALNAALMLGQISGSLNQNGFLEIPINNGGTITTLIIQWGFTANGSGSGNREGTYSSFWNFRFPSRCLAAFASIQYDPTSTGFDYGIGVASAGSSPFPDIDPSGGRFYLNFFGGGTQAGYFSGWWWIAIGD